LGLGWGVGVGLGGWGWVGGVLGRRACVWGVGLGVDEGSECHLHCFKSARHRHDTPDQERSYVAAPARSITPPPHTL